MRPGFQRYWHADQAEPQFLLDWREPGQSRRRRIALFGALLWHFTLLTVVINAPGGNHNRNAMTHLEALMRHATPLIAPRLDEFKLTQKDPQRHKPADEVDLASLQPRQALQAPMERPAAGGAAPGLPQPPRVAPQPIEAPKIEIAQQSGIPQAPDTALLQRNQPPPPPPQAKTNPFEAVTAPKQQPAGLARMGVQASSVEEATRELIRSGAAGRPGAVGDRGAGLGGVSDPFSQPGAAAQRQSALELLSDAQGVDFKPYLIQVLAAVRRSWFAVLPESTRFGRTGRAVIHFAVDKDGKVLKLVIAMPSGAEALDRAAVAGISGAVPFPPFPPGFRGQEVRLQLVFSYNMPK